MVDEGPSIEEALASARRLKASILEKDAKTIDRAATVDLHVSTWLHFILLAVSTSARDKDAAKEAKEDVPAAGFGLL